MLELYESIQDLREFSIIFSEFDNFQSSAKKPVGGFREEDENVKNCFCHHKKSSIIGGTTITLCAQTAHKTNIYMKLRLVIFSILAVTFRTDETGRRTQDAGH